MRFIHNSKHNACGVCRRFVGSFLVTIVLLVSVVVAIILGSSFRQGVLGQFLIGFLTSFGTGLLIDFPKLAALYFIYKKSILIKRYNFVKEIEREVAEEKARIAAEGGKRKKKGKKKDKKKKKKQARTRRAPSLSSTEPLRRAPEMVWMPSLGVFAIVVMVVVAAALCCGSGSDIHSPLVVTRVARRVGSSITNHQS